MIESLDFIAVPSRDADRSRAFYVDTLGLRPDEGSQYEFWVGETCFGIWEPEKLGREFAASRNGHAALHVADVAATRQELEAKGVEFLGETLDTGVCHMALFQDPGRQRPDAAPPLRGLDNSAECSAARPLRPGRETLEAGSAAHRH